MMESPKLCIDCGQPLAVGSQADRCRSCVFSLALDAGETEPEEADLRDLVGQPCPPAEVKLHQFGDYELIDEVARGGMGVVFRAHQSSVGRTVALKFIVGHQVNSSAARRRFRQEAEVAAQLDHPNIVPIYEAGEHNGHPFLCMKYIEGETLAERLRGGKIPQPQVLMAKVARAVHCAHGRGVLHRDLKPSNILIDECGEPYVTDFGLAKFADTDSDLTRSTAMMGTPRYMSPEQCRGDNANVSTASDTFSLGVILYEMLAGRPPFEGDSTLEVIRKVNEELPPTLTLSGNQRDLATICFKCLEKAPSQRYSSALALAEDLEHFGRGEPISARPVGTLESAWKWAKRKPGVAASLAAAAVAMLLGTAIALLQAHEAKAARNELAVNFYASEMAHAYNASESGRTHNARDILTKLMPNHGDPDLRGWEWRWLWKTTASNYEAELKGHTLPISCLAISPDGYRIFSGDSGGRALLWDVATRTSREVFNESRYVIGNAAFSNDGHWLCFRRWRLGSLGPTESTVMVYRIDDDGVVTDGPIATVPAKSSFHFLTGTDGRCRLLIQMGSEEGFVLWDFNSEPLPNRDRLLGWNFDDGMAVLAISPKSQFTCIGSDDEPIITIIETTNGSEISQLSLPWGGAGKLVSFSPSGDRLAVVSVVGSEEAKLYQCAIYDWRNRSKICQFPASLDQRRHLVFLTENEVCFYPDDSLDIPTWSLDTDEGTARPYRVLRGIRSKVDAISPAPSGAWAATGSADGSVMLWKLVDSPPPSEAEFLVEPCRGNPLHVFISPDGRFIAGNAGNKNNDFDQVLVWDRVTSSHVNEVSGMPVWLAPDGKRMITYRFDTKSEGRYTGPDGTYSFASIQALEYWDLSVRPARSVKVIPLPEKIQTRYSTAGATATDGQWLALGSALGELCILHAETGNVIIDFEPTGGVIGGLQFSWNKRYLAYAGNVSGVLDVDKRQRIAELPGTRSVVYVPAFSPDDQYLAIGPADGTIQLYELTHPEKPIAILTGHYSEVRKVAFSPDGRTLASVEHNKVLKLWNVAARSELASFPVTGVFVQFSQDGRFLYTGAGYPDAQLKVRYAPSLAEIDANTQVIGRPLQQRF